MNLFILGFMLVLNGSIICLAADSEANPTGLSHLKSPNNLAETEYIVSVDSGYDGQTCTQGVAYRTKGSKDWINGTFVFSTTEEFLKKSGELTCLQDLLIKGECNPDLMTLFCGDAHYSHLANIGKVSHRLFDHNFVSIGDTSQDMCGDATVTILGNKGSNYFGVSLDLQDMSIGYTCDKEKDLDYDCVKRNQCLKQFLASESNVAAIKVIIIEFLDALEFD